MDGWKKIYEMMYCAYAYIGHSTWAGRSVEDRLLGMEEDASSNCNVAFPSKLLENLARSIILLNSGSRYVNINQTQHHSHLFYPLYL